ncbi:MAG: S-layer homology domain-containing protein [Bacillota bacterium]
MCIVLLASSLIPVQSFAQGSIDVLFEGTVNLSEGETFTVTAYNSGSNYAIKQITPLGALHEAAKAAGFTYDVTDKKYTDYKVLLLDNVGSYKFKSPGSWYAYVNNVYKDGYANPADGLNILELADGDRVEFYYAAGISDPTNIGAVKEKATAAVKITVSVEKSVKAVSGATKTANNENTSVKSESVASSDQSAPQLRIVKYAADRTTVIAEKIVDYKWMEENLEVIGDGKRVYRFEGVTFDPNNLWDPEETYPGGFKIENAVKGTRLRDLCELVGGMGSGTEIVLVAKDGYETRLPYSSIYPDPHVQARQGDAILAWWADGKYVPEYTDGMRLFFTPEDGIYGQWDMHETLPEKYWTYYYSGGIMYPSCAGLSAKYITEIRVYSVPETDWTLKLDGRDIGGLEYEVSKTYFEHALSCQFGANHKASYTDSQGRVWEGMPLWFLVGFVDDEDQHSSTAFNDDLAKAGYDVIITASDGFSVTLDSRDIMRNSDYIVANTLNGTTFPESSSYWPLRLVGPNVKGATSISKITSIKLVPKPFKDIAGHWAENNIKELFAFGAIGGYPDGTFKPDKEITRAEFATILVKALKLEQKSDKVFRDTADHWAKDAIATAADYGIVQGYPDNTFRPDEKITREQMAAMIVRAVNLAPAAEELSFADSSKISKWAKEAVATAVETGIMEGYTDNTIRPQAKTTRAEAVTVIVNALKVEK